MLYNKNKEAKLDLELFKNPTNEYRGAPFWAWNNNLNIDRLTEQIEYFKEMGFGGFHMHSRDGMAAEYLGEHFMETVKKCTEKAMEKGLFAYIYDEDRCPSGFAGGLVTKNPQYRQRILIVTRERLCEPTVSFDKAAKNGKPCLLASFCITLNSAGELEDYYSSDSDNCKANCFAYLCTPPEKGYYNNQTYVDTLSKPAVDEFIKLTLEKYKNTVGQYFGNTIPAIFTDEPQFACKRPLNSPFEHTSAVFPWTVTFNDTFKKKYNYDIIQKIPELIWEKPNDSVSEARYHYHEHITERFTEAFSENYGRQCRKNGIALTGHMMEEPTLESQTASVGEAMRAYPNFDIPGIDILCNSVELTTAKQAQSVVHQYGKEGMISELYGVTNWDFDFRGHKFQGDWQAALGVTIRVSHLSLVSMGGDAKRDYPASIFYQSPWYKEYSYVEDHFARTATALTRGKPIVKIGVIHPIESFWLHFGTKQNTGEMRRRLDERFKNITEWLLSGTLDFDFISEVLLPEQYADSDIVTDIKIGYMQYSAIVVPACETLRKTTVDILTEYRKRGGRVIFCGAPPKYMDAKLSEKPKELYDMCVSIEFDKLSVLAALKNERIVEIRNQNGEMTDNLIYTLRQDGNSKWLFIAHTGIYSDNWRSYKCSMDLAYPQNVIIKIKGTYSPIIYNTADGTTQKTYFELKNGYTHIPYTLYANDSLLLLLEKCGETAVSTETPKKEYEIINTVDIKENVGYSLSEPNVMLLDMAEYALDEEVFSSTEEILRIDKKLRERLDYTNNGTQPWAIAKKGNKHRVTLKFTFESKTEIADAKLAVENAKECEIFLNDKKVLSNPCGFFADKFIETVKLPNIVKGKNTLILKIPFDELKKIEWCYILGDFGVELNGCKKTLVKRGNKIGFSSVCTQGLPFYGANITYKTKVSLPAGDIVIHANNYRGAAIKVYFDGEPCGIIAYAPYEIRIKQIKDGTHTIDYELLGNRHNSFGPLHNADNERRWFGNDAWYTSGDSWCYEYRLKDFGILSSPIIKIVK